MKRFALALALAATLPGCATMPVQTEKVSAAVTQAADAWDRFHALVKPLVALLPADRQTQVTAWLAIGDKAAAAARVAATTADALAALAQAQSAMVSITAALPKPVV